MVDVSNASLSFLIGSENPLMHNTELVVTSIDVRRVCFHVSRKLSEQYDDPEQ